MNNYFADNIKFLRRQRKLTQTDLGKLFGKAKTTISSWEIGERTPTSNDLRMVANYFGISVDHLMNEDLTVVTDLDAKMKADFIATTVERAKLTDEEFDKIMTYIEFVISQRKR